MAAAACGALLLALEVVWFRLLSMYVLVTTLAVSLMLAVVLAGIGIGSLVASYWLRRAPDAAHRLQIIAAFGGLATVATYGLFQGITSGTQVGAWQTVLWFACVLTLPASIVSGLLFTLLGDAIHDGADAAASAGWLTLANTAGAMCGPPAAAYVLMPAAGVERTIVMLAAGYLGVALLTSAAAGRATRRCSPPMERAACRAAHRRQRLSLRWRCCRSMARAAGTSSGRPRRMPETVRRWLRCAKVRQRPCS